MSESTISGRAPAKWLELAVASSGAMLIVAGIALDPDFVAGHLSPDGQISARTAAQITALRWLSAAAGITLLLAQAGVRWGLGKDTRWVIARIESSLAGRQAAARIVALSVVVLACAALNLRSTQPGEWGDAHGAEYAQIAKRAAAGHGFSNEGSNRWYWFDHVTEDASEAGKYYPTAIEEPLYPLALAGLISSLGKDTGTTVMVALQVLAWLGACFLTYALGSAVFGRPAGLFAGISFALWPPASYLTTGYLGPGPFGTLLFTLTAYLTVRFVQRGRGTASEVVALGVLLGVSMLTLASSQVFIPVVAASVLLSLGWRRPRAWAAAGAVVLIAALLVSPWTIRNWMVFGEFVPVRTGIGLIGHQGSPTLAGTYHPGPHACTDTLGPMWEAEGPYEAIYLASHDQAKEYEVYRRSFECIAEAAPPGYENYNEVQRDQFYLERTKDFIQQEPLIFAELAVAKYVVMVRGWSPAQAIAGILCLAALVLAFRHASTAIVGIMILAYVAPYALGIPWFYRYRFPIEPLILVLATGLVTRVATALSGYVRKSPAN